MKLSTKTNRLKTASKLNVCIINEQPNVIRGVADERQVSRTYTVRFGTNTVREVMEQPLSGKSSNRHCQRSHVIDTVREVMEQTLSEK